MFTCSSMAALRKWMKLMVVMPTAMMIMPVATSAMIFTRSDMPRLRFFSTSARFLRDRGVCCQPVKNSLSFQVAGSRLYTSATISTVMVLSARSISMSAANWLRTH